MMIEKPEAQALLSRMLHPNGPFGTQSIVAFIGGKFRKVTRNYMVTDGDKARLKAAEEKRYNRRTRNQHGGNYR